MRTKKIFITILSALVLTALFMGCTSAPGKEPAPIVNTNTPQQTNSQNAVASPVTPTQSDQKPVINQTVKIGDILSNPKNFSGKTVIVEGKIASECPSGCWFTLKDGTAVIYIDLEPSNLVIPQKRGASAKVTAQVEYNGSDVFLIGKKVEF